MAPRKPTPAAVAEADAPETSANGQASPTPRTLLYDHTIETDKGRLRIRVDAIETINAMQEYYNHLVFTRGLPFNSSVLAPNDPVMAYVSTAMPWMEAGDVQDYARSYYDQLLGQVQSEAFLLAACADEENVLDFEPEAYLDPGKSLPGIQKMPEPRRDLRHPTERRLKQIMDVMSADPAIMARLLIDIQGMQVEVARRFSIGETDRSGF